MMLDYERRKNYAVPSFGRELAKNKIFREIVLQPLEASNRLQHSAAGSNGWAHGELHAFQHSRDQRASPKIGVHAGGFEARPETCSWHSAVRTGRHPEMCVLKFGRDRAQKIGSHTNVAVTHHHQIVAG